jgi:hypothetical protein
MVDIAKLITALESLDTALSAFGKSNPTKFSDHHGASAPPLDAMDLSCMAEALARKIGSLDWSAAESADLEKQVEDLTPKIQWAISSLVPNLFGNATASISIVSLLHAIDLQISDCITPSIVSKSLQIPLDLRKDAARANARLSTALQGIGQVDSKLTAINDAFEAATKLPATMEDLESAIKEIEALRNTAQESEKTAKEAADACSLSSEKLEKQAVEADEIMRRVNAAFRAATSHGLAHAFTKKAFHLNVSMYGWAVLLVLALGFAVVVGSTRFPEILKAASERTSTGAIEWGLLVVQIVLAALSLGAPVWLSWVATKQIGQRFRLAEDYAYKAALSAAYEGYRTEASDLDPVLKAQLFSIALTRLDEIPLRLIEQDVAGSPLHELIKSSEFREALREVPGLQARVVGILGRLARTSAGKKVDAPPEPEPLNS